MIADSPAAGLHFVTLSLLTVGQKQHVITLGMSSSRETISVADLPPAQQLSTPLTTVHSDCFLKQDSDAGAHCL